MFFIWVILGGLLQVTILRDTEFLLLITIFLGLRKGPLSGALVGGLIGIVAGIFSVSSFGMGVVLYSLIGFTSGFAKRHIYYKEGVLMYFVFSFVGVILFYCLYFILIRRFEGFIFSTAFFSAIISPILFKILEKTHSF